MCTACLPSLSPSTFIEMVTCLMPSSLTCSTSMAVPLIALSLQPEIVASAPEYRALFGTGTQGALALYKHEHTHSHDCDHAP